MAKKKRISPKEAKNLLPMVKEFNKLSKGFLKLLGQKIDHKERIKAESLETDSDKIISLYADTQRLYSKESMIELSKIIQNNKEEADIILFMSSALGNKATLNAIFGASNEDTIKEFKTIIAAEYEEGNIGGITSYIYNARFGESSILASARNLIKHTTNICN